MAVERAIAEVHSRQANKVARGAEESRMRRNSAERECVFIVHLAAQVPLAPGVYFRGSNPVHQCGCGPVERLSHPQRCENALLKESIERLPAHSRDNFAEDDRTK